MEKDVEWEKSDLKKGRISFQENVSGKISGRRHTKILTMFLLMDENDISL